MALRPLSALVLVALASAPGAAATDAGTPPPLRFTTPDGGLDDDRIRDALEKFKSIKPISLDRYHFPSRPRLDGLGTGATPKKLDFVIRPSPPPLGVSASVRVLKVEVE